ncbi:methyl-accepting chemotaxis protein [Sporomusa ovata]|uniref:Methyl-accepting chemotaxis protein n=1 Tax=Sporomusa ovata TaxID=2378 RepID=A0A0U1KUN7_9FIRM|nr:methyl-accepting chemotaxis protein [Sporomusa ovata]CQR71170.1 Methyl-accepting chemotaxis protein [Sporomusa ovata]
MNKRFEGIRFRLISLSVTLILFTAIPIGIIADNMSQSALMKNYVNASVEQLATIEDAANIFQGAIDNDIKMFASNPLIVRADETITKYLENIDEKKLMTPSKNGGIEQEIFGIFDNYAKSHPGILYVYMGTESGGYIQWPETSNSAKYDPRKRPWYTSALKASDKISRTDPYIDSTNGNMIVSNSFPIKASDGRIIGVMAIDASSEKVTSILDEIKIGETGYCMIIHKTGLVIADPSNPKNNGKYVKDIGLSGLEKMLDSKQQVQTELTINGTEYFVISRKSAESDLILASFITTKELYKTSSYIRWIILSVCLVTLLIACILTYIGSGKISKPIVTISNVAQRIANGDLSVNIEPTRSKGEIGLLENSIEQMIVNLRKMIQSTAHSADQLAASAQELSASSAQSAEAASYVAASITKVAAGIEDERAAANEAAIVVENMSSGVQKMAITAEKVTSQSIQATDRAQDGSETAGKAVRQMIQIEETVNTSAQVVVKLGERSKEIGQIVDTISGIAGQTNLLALNAAIEAARAGEQGKGFAVVAEEVRKLAEQSREAAKKIEALIAEIQVDTEKAVVAMTDGTREVKKGTEAVNDAGLAFREITDLVTQVSSQVKEISVAISEMATGSQQIVGSVKKIDDLSKNATGEAQSVSAATEEQLASMEEIASASQALTHLAEEMLATVRHFKI